MLDVITDNLDIWTTAQKQKKAVGRGRAKKDESYGIKKLRELILELAVRGKLVPQDASDEPASILLERIAEEKQRLIEEGKVRKQKTLSVVGDNEKTFVLPDRWEWIRLGSLFNSIISGGTPSKRNPEYWEGDIPWASVKDLGTSKYISDTQDHITSYGLESGSKLAEEGDILICTRMGLGKIAIVKNSLAFNQDLKAVKLTSLLSADFFINTFSTLKIKGTGTTVAGIKQEQLLDYVIGLPPLTEQHRIVTKVDELMTLCDQLEQQQADQQITHQTLVETLLNGLVESAKSQAKSEMNDQQSTADYFNQLIAEHFDTLFTTEQSIDQLKQIILQLAVMGKLVPQDPNDEPASVLLEKIAEEKTRLIKVGKIKKQKASPEVGEGEKLFGLPDEWEWVRLSNLLPSFQNGASSRGDKEGKEVIVLRLADIKNWSISLEDTRSLVIAESTIDRYSLEQNDVLIIRVNGSADIVGRFILCDQDLDVIYCDHFIRMRFPLEIMTSSYLKLLGSSSLVRSSISDLFISTAGQKTVNQKHIGSLLLSLPPINEQHRIVTKVNQLLTLCNSLKANLNQAQTTQTQLADAIVKQAVN